MALNKLISGLEIEKGEKLAQNVWEAKYQLREVAVKEISNKVEAFKEIQAYSNKDFGENMIRLYDYLPQHDRVQLVLQRAQCSLPQFFDLFWCRNVSFMTPSKEDFQRNKVPEFRMGYRGFPSPLLLKMIRDVLIGAESLWKNNLSHDFLEPENVMVFNDLTAKIAMNQRVHNVPPPDVNADLFGLGQVVHYIVSAGERGYRNGEYCVSRRILGDKLADVVDLIARL